MCLDTIFLSLVFYLSVLLLRYTHRCSYTDVVAYTDLPDYSYIFPRFVAFPFLGKFKI
jgi:hypothetical protein